MTDSRYADLPIAATFTGAETLALGQGGRSVRASIAAILLSAAYTPTGVGAVPTTVAQKLARSVDAFDYMTAAQQNNVALNIGSIDVTTAIQNAINANAGLELFFPAGKYLTTSAPTIINGCRLRAVFGFTTIVLGAQNQNGFVIGNGTAGGNSTSIRTTIDGFIFNPLSSVTAFTSGSCVFMNYCQFAQVRNCTFYGFNGTSNLLFRGVTIFQGTECTVSNNYFYNLLDYGIYTSGTSSVLRTVDGRFDQNEFVAIGNACVQLDAFTAGCTINNMIAYGFTTWGIVINSGTSGSGSLHYIGQPDIEADGTSGGIYIQNCSNVDIDGGWVGTTTFAGTTPSLWVGVLSNSVKVTGSQLLFGRVQVDGAACTFTGCDVVGDNVAVTMGYQISSTATDTTIVGGKVRQHAAGGIQFTSTPPAARCVIDGVGFKNCGPVAGTGYEVVGSTGLPGSIVGVSGTPSLLPPVIQNCTSDVPYAYAAAATGKIVTSAGRDMIQVTASANITTITPLGLGSRIRIQAGAGGITLASGGNIQLKTSPTTIPAFNFFALSGDGQNQFEDGRNF